MADLGLSWARWDGRECLRVEGADPGAALSVRPAALGDRRGLPAMAGSWVHDGDSRCFLPRFGFVDGESYVVDEDGLRGGELRRPSRAPASPSVEVSAIFPTAPVVPRNVLRFYVLFSGPMSEGAAASHVRLLDADGADIAGAIMPSDYELWDADRRRLTVLLDPARIKQGLVSNRLLGYPLEVGQTVRLVVDEDFADARGLPLCREAARSYLVGPDERRLVDPARWRLEVPRAGTNEALRVEFDRVLDHALLMRCFHLRHAEGRPVVGRSQPGPGETAWLFEPRRAWSDSPYELAVAPILEDVAGNSLERIFDRDLAHSETGSAALHVLAFRPRP